MSDDKKQEPTQRPIPKEPKLINENFSRPLTDVTKGFPVRNNDIPKDRSKDKK